MIKCFLGAGSTTIAELCHPGPFSLQLKLRVSLHKNQGETAPHCGIVCDDGTEPSPITAVYDVNRYVCFQHRRLFTGGSRRDAVAARLRATRRRGTGGTVRAAGEQDPSAEPRLGEQGIAGCVSFVCPSNTRHVRDVVLCLSSNRTEH